MTALQDQARKLRELLTKATQGPWMLQDGCFYRRIGTHFHDGDVLCLTSNARDGHPDLVADGGKLYDNLNLIVTAVNALPELLTALEAKSAADREAIARIIEPKLFDDDPIERHRAASPFTVEVRQQPILETAARILALITPPAPAPHTPEVTEEMREAIRILGMWRDEFPLYGGDDARAERYARYRRVCDLAISLIEGKANPSGLLQFVQSLADRDDSIGDDARAALRNPQTP